MNVAVVGGGITGLSAAETLARGGVRCTVYEKDATLGGLAGSFDVDGVSLEKFYHHLFTSDHAMVDLIRRLGLADRLEWLPTTNSYYAGRIYRFSTPLDLLRFTRLGLADRLRLGVLYLRTRRISDWRPLEGITAREWLVAMAGERVYREFWAPLLRSKFGDHADRVAAVWIWNKLKLRGGSRGSRQQELLGYVRGGFGQVLEAWEQRLRELGVEVRLGAPVQEIPVAAGRATGVVAGGERRPHDAVLVTTAPGILADMARALPTDYCARLRQITYLANVCLVMQLDRSLSGAYWLNIGDPTIPFTGVIEHTNMQRPERYGGAHLVYLSRYMDPDDAMYEMDVDELLGSYLPHLQKMFRGFDLGWVRRAWAWRERHTQPLITLHYSRIKPPYRTPVPNLWLSCMAQVYPEDRGMNYAVVGGRQAAEEILAARQAMG